MTTINLEYGMPDSAYALKHMELALSRAKASGDRAVKLIHGYGSSGKGGRIKSAVARELDGKQRSGRIKAWIKGEDYSAFNPIVLELMKTLPDLTRDSDYMKCNHGISIVILK